MNRKVVDAGTRERRALGIDQPDLDRPPNRSAFFCPWCGNQMDLGQPVWFVPDDGAHGFAVLCSESCLWKWTGTDSDLPLLTLEEIQKRYRLIGGEGPIEMTAEAYAVVRNSLAVLGELEPVSREPRLFGRPIVIV